MEQEVAATAHGSSFYTRKTSFSRRGLTSDFALSSRAALPLRNVCITKTQICCYSIPPADVQYTEHTRWLQLSSCLNHNFFQYFFFSSLRKMATRESGLERVLLSFREYGQHSRGTDLVLYFQGPSAVWC